MRTIRYLILDLIIESVLFGFWGCSSENIDNGDTEVQEDILVAFSIGTPESGEVEYTRADAANEKRINNLRVYDFLVTGSSAGRKALISTVHHLKKVSSNPQAGEFATEYNNETGAMTATLKLSLRGTGDTKIDPPHIFAFVANEAPIHFDTIVRPGVTPIDSLLYCLSTRKLKNEENCDKLAGNDGFVMTSLTGEMQITKNMGITELPQQLCRIVSRVDVTHNMLPIQNIKIVSVSATNCVSQGYLFSKDYAGAATCKGYDYTNVVDVKQNTTVQNELENLVQGTCENVLYLYEQNAEAISTPALVLTYTLNGAVNTIQIPKVLNNTRLNFQRNNKYKLVVGTDGGVSTRVVCTLETDE